MTSHFAKTVALALYLPLLLSCSDQSPGRSDTDSVDFDVTDAESGDGLFDGHDSDATSNNDADDSSSSDSSEDQDTRLDSDGDVDADAENDTNGDAVDGSSGDVGRDASETGSDRDAEADSGTTDTNLDPIDTDAACSGVSIMLRFAPRSTLFVPVQAAVTEEWIAVGVYDASGLRLDAEIEPTVSWPREHQVHEFGDCGDTDGLTCFRTPVPEDYSIGGRVRIDGRECEATAGRVVVTPADDIYVVMIPDAGATGDSATLPKLHAAPHENLGTMFDSNRDNPTAPSFDRTLIPRFPYACDAMPCVEVFILDDWPTYAYDIAVELPAAATDAQTVTVRGFANGIIGLDVSRTLEPGQYWYVADIRRSYVGGFGVQDTVTDGLP